MDKSTVGGLVGCTILFVIGILLGGPLMPFWDMPSVFIVLGGTFMALFIGFPTGAVVGGLKAGKQALFIQREYVASETVKMLSELSAKARSEGLLSLESAAEQTPDLFLQKGLRMMADGHDAGTLESVLMGEIARTDERHRSNVAIYDAIGAYGPALGMIGTLIGLVQMLRNLSDPTTIGPAMAVALLTTFYGSLLANLIGIPFANKLKQRSAAEIQHKELIVEGLNSILAGENPRFLVERLNATLAPSQRYQEAA